MEVWDQADISGSIQVTSEKSSGKPATGSTKKWYERSKVYQLNHILWAITLVIEKQNKLKRIDSARDRGMVVVCDRYPQSQISGFNDGPLLTNNQDNSSKLLRDLQQWEFESYQQMAETMPPDLVIKLNITPEVALARKSETPSEIVHKKVAAVKALNFPSQTAVITVDAEQPLDQVLVKAKRAVWKSI